MALAAVGMAGWSDCCVCVSGFVCVRVISVFFSLSYTYNRANEGSKGAWDVWVRTRLEQLSSRCSMQVRQGGG